MQRQRILVMGLDRDAAYAIRNIFEFERHDIDVCTELEMAREVLVERSYSLLIVDARVCMNEEFDLVDFQLEDGATVVNGAGDFKVCKWERSIPHRTTRPEGKSCALIRWEAKDNRYAV